MVRNDKARNHGPLEAAGPVSRWPKKKSFSYLLSARSLSQTFRSLPTPTSAIVVNMKFNFFAGLLVAVGGVVTALNDAAPHELQYMYNLYKTEWMLFPDAASALRLIAPKCKLID